MPAVEDHSDADIHVQEQLIYEPGIGECASSYRPGSPSKSS